MELGDRGVPTALQRDNIRLVLHLAIPSFPGPNHAVSDILALVESFYTSRVLLRRSSLQFGGIFCTAVFPNSASSFASQVWNMDACTRNSTCPILCMRGMDHGEDWEVPGAFKRWSLLDDHWAGPLYQFSSIRKLAADHTLSSRCWHRLRAKLSRAIDCIADTFEAQ